MLELADKLAKAKNISQEDALDVVMHSMWLKIKELIQDRAKEQGHLYGAPVPIEGFQLVVAKRFPNRQAYENINEVTFSDPHRDKQVVDPSEIVVNHFERTDADYFIIRQDGKTRMERYPIDRTKLAWQYAMRTATVGLEWDAEAEVKAHSKLKELIGTARINRYICSGIVMETSKRSNITYLFRRGKPTIAHSNWKGILRPIAALCLHGIGYYHQTFAGAMVPTDDLICHLLLMRADEHRYWRNCNIHKIEAVESGI